MKIVIVGGVAGGASAAARLRRLDEHAQIILLEKGPHISYANCGLPYYIGDVIQAAEKLTLQTPESFYKRFRIDVRINSEAVRILRDTKQIEIKQKDGSCYWESYDKLILSPGAKPIRPKLPGIDSPRIFTLRNIPDTFAIKDYLQMHTPKRILIVGGGYIGVELAENFVHAGCQVTIADMAEHVIAPLDTDMAAEVHQYLKDHGIRLYLHTAAQGFFDHEDGIDVQFTKHKECYDMVILAVGVAPDSALARECGLSVNARGAILVNEQLQTNDEDIYAIGDAIAIQHYVSRKEDYIALAGPANRQGRLVADHICGKPIAYNGTMGSSILKLFDMSIAMTGLNEAAAQAANIPYEKVFAYAPHHAAYYPDAKNLCIKLLFQPDTKEVLGAQIVGFEGVDKRIDVLATAIHGHMQIADLAQLELSYAPPFSSAKDPVNIAGFLAENLQAGLVKQLHVQDFARLDAHAQIIDVRTEDEYAAGHLDKSRHIPIDELRERLHELDKGQEVYLVCQSGLRSYLAARMLTQHGFSATHLAGGYRLYAVMMKEQPVDSSLHGICGAKLS